jgi:UDP-N-acetylmuramyl pentapeptide phosphotransferase/UDP-N-acetylglucosamine-1-phosphate transferase
MSLTVFYAITFAVLLACELIYFRIANRYHIGDNVTPRSSHKKYQLTGGGIIFIFAAIIYYIWQPKQSLRFDLVMLGAICLAVISFIDDIKSTSPILRLLIQSIVICLAFYYNIAWGYIDVFLVVFICGLGFINAYNFMDGINGITASYSLVTLTTMLCYTFTTPYFQVPQPFIVVLIIAMAIFAFFNCRKNAVCFAGDVGSIVIGFFIMYMIVELCWATADATCIILVSVYGVDTAFTIIQRLFAGENILLPHRHHLYQVLANQWGIEHYKVSLYYASTQLVINGIYILIPRDYHLTYFIFVIVALSFCYFTLKRSKLSRMN